MDKLVQKIVIRNLIEVGVLVALVFFFHSNKNISGISLIPFGLVLLVFLFDFYKIFKFTKNNDSIGLREFESKFLFYSFGWYFLPLLITIFLILRDLNAVRLEVVVGISVLYLFIYYLNYVTSKKLKEELQESK
jgi:hypothetical protein